MNRRTRVHTRNNQTNKRNKEKNQANRTNIISYNKRNQPDKIFNNKKHRQTYKGAADAHDGPAAEARRVQAAPGLRISPADAALRGLLHTYVCRRGALLTKCHTRMW